MILNTFSSYLWKPGFMRIPRLSVPPAPATTIETGMVTWGDLLPTKAASPTHLLRLLNSEQCVPALARHTVLAGPTENMLVHIVLSPRLQTFPHLPTMSIVPTCQVLCLPRRNNFLEPECLSYLTLHLMALHSLQEISHRTISSKANHREVT